MEKTSFTSNDLKVTSKIVLGVYFLVFGCTIYLLFRSKSLNIYRWCISIGLSDTIDTLRHAVQYWYVSDIVKFSLPDGLYCAAYILLIDAIWNNDNCFAKYFIISLIPIVTIISEILQYFGIVVGTFDIYDLICYVLPPLIYIGLQLFSYRKKNMEKNDYGYYITKE